LSSSEKRIFLEMIDSKSSENDLYVDDILDDNEDFDDSEDEELNSKTFKKPQEIKKVEVEDLEEDLFPEHVILDANKSKKEGAVLRFSELFKSPEIPPVDDAFVLKKKLKKKKGKKHEIQLETNIVHVELEDEGEELEKSFETMTYEVQIKKPKTIEKKSERSEDVKKIKRVWKIIN
jgi:hypothetical protein